VRGRAALNLGRLAQARESYTLANDRFREMGIETGSWEARIGLCGVALESGDTTAAIDLARRTLADCAAAGYAEGEEFLALTLCDLLRRRARARPARLAEAHELATRAVELSRRDGRRKREALALARRAAVCLAAGEAAAALPGETAPLSAARRDAAAACRLAGEIRSPEVTWACERWGGAAAAAEGDLDAAAAHYTAALDALEAIRRDLRLEEFKAAYLAGRIDLYYEAAAVLTRLGRPDAALAICERARARALRDLLGASPRPLAPQVSAALAARLDAIETELRTLEASRAAIAARAAPDRARLAELDRRIARQRRRWDEVRSEVLLADPHYGQRVAPTATATTALCAALDAGEALLEYLLGPDSSLCFIARRDGIVALHLPVGRRELAAQVGALCDPWHAPRSLATLPFDLESAGRIRRSVIDPAAPHLTGVHRLLLVPDGALCRLPFAALPLAEDSPLAPPGGGPGAAAGRSQDREAGGGGTPLHGSYRDSAFLDDLFTLEIYPAAELISRAPSTDGHGAPAPRGRLLAFGFGAGEDPAASAAAARPLPHVAAELEAIARAYPGAVIALDGEAREQRFKSAAPGFDYLHLATHAIIDERVPLYSGLFLAPDSAGGEDGTLHAHEILEVPLQSRLVALSACETGLGRLYAGEGLLGLARSFFYAGARQMLVSLWSVNDASTAVLMGRFYEQLAEGRTAPEALRAARRALRRESGVGAGGTTISYAHPYFWAPFVLLRASADD
jgi:hypothetical protein